MSSSILRVVRNLFRVGPRDYFRQMNGIGDTKAGTLVGVDSYGNKFFENTEEDEIHMRTRWVQYKDYYGDMSQVEPAWHFWLGYGVDTPPNKTAEKYLSTRAYPAPTKNYQNFTGTPGAYVPYSTVRPKVSSWDPKVAARA
ncbi:putative mitochondrial Complex I, 17.2 kd subunit [Sugiyamaella lignohabitans]|uniref:NADH dehydrogenase [ubiquinone] 1 alpha subcomplex subunit n=1 Tax=Sugiyamaella lignohabitans TaxID=796027 RepID=A0A161HHE8_9ASCO|nr:putative mitochondrial Complex I, 17.2 kd subunit [Sugiyamaella lignohabitans]ANB11557.1 putative mitochondrial Complex I, 17.2 kd subunit [Sugiyamaella lignohabitans]